MKHKIEIRYEKKDFQEIIKSRTLIIFINKVLKEINYVKYSCSIFFTTNETMQQLNRQYRNKDYPTDVLSFSQVEGINADYIKSNFLGDIAISIPYAKDQAIAMQVDIVHEIYLLILHGLLHLTGLDHEKKNDKKMLQLQMKIYKKLTGLTLNYGN
jgi:probable rRNA maturation factor